MKRFVSAIRMPFWSRELALLVTSVFFLRFGEGVVGGARMNFFIDTLGLTGGQVLWLEGIREIPGLALMFIAALVMHLPLARRGAVSVLIIGLGYALYATVHSYAALLAMVLVASLGFHGWMPIQPALAMGLAPKEMSGRVMGSLASVGALASIVGMGAIALVSGLMERWSLRLYYLSGGLIIVIAALLLFRLPANVVKTPLKQPRLLVRRRYWLYYVLTFFEGARKEVMGSFCSLVLVQQHGFKVWQMSALLVTSAVLNFLLAPLLGYLVDRLGERRMMPISYIGLALCALGYAFIQQTWLLVGLLVLIKILMVLGMGLSTYVNRVAPAEELSPTLTAGVSINHISSVAMPLVAGVLLPVVGYSGIYLGTAILIAFSVPFALGLRIGPEPVIRLQSAPAE